MADLKGVVRRVLVYTGARKLATEDGIGVWPVASLLAALKGRTLWP